MKILKIDEYDIDIEIENKILNLLVQSFPDVYPDDRIYYKQIPNFRYMCEKRL